MKTGTNDAILFIEDINRDGTGDKFFSVSGVTSNPVVNDTAYLTSGKDFGFIDSTDSFFYLSGNDGFIHIFDRGSNLNNERVIKTGLFSSDSLFINSSNGGEVLSTISTNSHVILSSRNSDLVNPPTVEWSQINQFAQPLFALDSDGNGRHEFVSLFTDSEGYTEIFLHASNGGLLWGWTVGEIISMPRNFISGDFDGDGFKDIAFTFTSEEKGSVLYALRGLDGSEIGSHDPAGMKIYLNNDVALLPDINGDSANEILLVHSLDAEIIRGIDFLKIKDFDIVYWGTNISVFNFDNSHEYNIFANQRSGGQKQMFDTEGSEVWKINTSLPEDSLYQYYTPYPGISKIDTDEGFDIVLGGKFGDISAYSGDDGAVLWRRCLSDSLSSDISVSVIPASVLCSGTTLSNIVTGDIDGDSLDEFVTGDKNGNLYVINSEDGALTWTVKFDGAIGNPVLADVNDDGKIEILVGAGDGFLYAIGQRVFVPAPEFVRDVAVVDGEITSTTDIDEMVFGKSYGGIWKGVDSALKYEVKLTDQDETVMKEMVVTGANQIVIDNLQVETGDTLYLSVRTINSGGYDSGWTRSNGVTVVDKEIISDDDIIDTDTDVPDDEDTAEDLDIVADVDNIADIDKVEDTDPVIDENTADDTADELYEDDDSIDQTTADNDETEIRSKNSGCGCSVL